MATGCEGRSTLQMPASEQVLKAAPTAQPCGRCQLRLCIPCRPVAEDCEGPGLLRVPAPEQLEALGPRRALYFVSVTPRETPAAEAHWAGQHNRALGLRPSLELEPIKTLKMGPLLGMVSSFVGLFVL